jgi:hypothetical protein
MQTIIARIRQEKADKVRARPSSTLIDQSQTLTSTRRHETLDKVASLVDENLCCRSEICLQFADLLYRGVVDLNIPARPVLGDAIYFLKRPSFWLSSQAENPLILRILSIGDEFR